MADLKVEGGPDTAAIVAAVGAKRPRTITLTFSDEDASLYDEIVSDAKTDRRTPSQFLVLYLAANYNTAAEAK